MDKATEHGPYTYNYDSLYRLAGAVSPVLPQESFSYDPVGNRLTSATANNWTYNQNNELQSYNGVSFQYDLNGNTTQRNDNGTVQNFLYNEDDRLTEVKDANGAIVATYYYDPFGRRLWKEVRGARTYFMYADEGLVAEFDGTGSQPKSYGYAPNSTWTTNPLFMKQGTQYYFYHNDHLGTPQKMTAVNGSTVWNAKYESFGKAVVDVSSTIENNLRFPGQYYDQETGFHYNYHRYYDQKTGRYTTSDPIGLVGGMNLYLYVFSKPLNRLDANGLIVNEVYEFIVAGLKFASQGYMQLGIEGAGAVLNSAELVQSMLQNRYDRPPSLDEILDAYIVFSLIIGAEAGEQSAFTLEMVWRAYEDAFRQEDACQERVSDTLKKWRLRYSDWSTEYKDFLNDFIAGGNRKDTFITSSRREVSEWGNINKSLMVELAGDLARKKMALVKAVVRDLRR